MFPTFEKVRELAKKQGLSLNQVEEKLGYSKNTLYSLKRQKVSSERLQEIADYFNVSVDYLLGREKPQEDEYEQQLVAMFRKQTDGMNDSQKEKFNKSLDKLFSVAEVLLSDEDNWKGD